MGLVKTVLPPARELCFEYFEASETRHFWIFRFTVISGGIFMTSGYLWGSTLAPMGTTLETSGQYFWSVILRYIVDAKTVHLGGRGNPLETKLRSQMASRANTL